jgi:hypothetical protein
MEVSETFLCSNEMLATEAFKTGIVLQNRGAIWYDECRKKKM